MTDLSDHSHADQPSQSQTSTDLPEVGYKKPPKHSQFPKGKSGNPSGRPKAPVGISIKDILDGDQTGKNGEVISKREAIVIRMLNDALAGNQKAFGKIPETPESLQGSSEPNHRRRSRISFTNSRPMTPEEYEEFKRNFGRPMGEPRR